MRKKEAAEFLGISIKSLERYTQKKRLGVSYVKGKNGNEADYDQVELEKFKEELNKTTYVPSISVHNEKDLENGSAKPSSTLITLPSLTIEEGSARVLSLLETIVSKQKENSLVEIGQKLTLSLAEASRLAGLSIGYLKAAIKEGSLKASKRGKGWNIKREDLEVWVKSL
jgi:excisionase family DNA binding protein